jgi:hypothetical protein
MLSRTRLAPAALISRLCALSDVQRDGTAAIAIYQQVIRGHPDYDDWINLPLLNRTGRADDFIINKDSECIRPTPYAKALPTALLIVDDLRRWRFAVHNVRLAILAPGGVLRCHVDMHQSIRLLFQLNESGRQFRHLFEDICVSMRAGELWAVNGQSPHGAANLSRTTQRALLIIDGQAAETFRHVDKQTIPRSRTIDRKPWTKVTFQIVLNRLHAVTSVARVEREILRLPFIFRMSARNGYDLLVQICERKALIACCEKTAHLWTVRAEHWRNHNCICVNTD